MSWLVVFLWVSNILFDTVGQLSFKAAAIQPSPSEHDASVISYWKQVVKQPILWLGIFSYIAEFFLWLAFLTLVPLSEGVLLGSVNIIIIMICGRLFFNEKLTPLRVLGISLIAVGVALVGVL